MLLYLKLKTVISFVLDFLLSGRVLNSQESSRFVIVRISENQEDFGFIVSGTSESLEGFGFIFARALDKQKQDTETKTGWVFCLGIGLE